MSDPRTPADVARSYVRIHGGRARALHAIARLQRYLDLSGLGEREPFFQEELDLAIEGIAAMGGPPVAPWSARKEAQVRALLAESVEVALRDIRARHERLKDDPTRVALVEWDMEVASVLETMGEKLPTGWDFPD